MSAINNISKFNTNLLIAFDKMIRGISVEITEEARKFWGIENMGRWFFIISVNCDETVTLCTSTHTILNSVKLSDIKTNKIN